MFENPEQRAIALARIKVLKKLTDDLTAIVEGNKPSTQDLESAVTLQGFVGERSVPCLVGMATDHPMLGSRWITTSQIFALDPNGRWARTLSRFYRLELVPTATADPGTVQ